MPIDRAIWVNAYAAESFPAFPCPHCHSGRVSLDKQTLRTEETNYSKRERDQPDWEPSWMKNRFVAFLRCGVDQCGEVVAVSGDVETGEWDMEEHDWDNIETLKPLNMYPAPPIITLPKETPCDVANALRLAFQLFWSDWSACANCLRKSVELLLDDFVVPREAITKSGKTRYLTLDERVKEFEVIDAHHAVTFNALRMVGNLGSHEQITWGVLLDALEIYEDALAELYGKRSAKIDALRSKIIISKGRY